MEDEGKVVVGRWLWLLVAVVRTVKAKPTPLLTHSPTHPLTTAQKVECYDLRVRLRPD